MKIKIRTLLEVVSVLLLLPMNILFVYSVFVARDIGYINFFEVTIRFSTDGRIPGYFGITFLVLTSLIGCMCVSMFGLLWIKHHLQMVNE